MEKNLIRCEKCGSTNVVDHLLEDVKVTVLTMDDYIKQNKSRSLWGANVVGIGQLSVNGTSHMDRRVLECRDCGYQRPWDQVVYT